MHDEHLLMTICPKHRNDFGIGWRCQKKLCQVPQSMVPHHKSKKRRKQKTLTFSHSRHIFAETAIFVPVGACKCASRNCNDTDEIYSSKNF